LPALDGFRTTEAILLLRFYKSRKKGTLLSLIKPFEAPPARPKRIYQNIIYEGLKLQSFIESSPTRITWARASQELQISDSKIAHLLKIVNAMPPDFVETMRSCSDEAKLKIFNKRRLLRISRLQTDKERRNEIERLLPKT